MKKLSKLLALLLALAMVFCLVACGAEDKDDEDDKDDKGSSNVEDNDDKDDKDNEEEEEEKEEEEEETDAEKIVGEWSCRFDLRDMMHEKLSEEMDGEDSFIPNKALYMTLSLEFERNGEFTLAAEIDQSSMNDYMDALIDNLVDYMYDMAEDQGMSKTQFDDAIEQQYGMSVNEYINDTFEQLL